MSEKLKTLFSFIISMQNFSKLNLLYPHSRVGEENNFISVKHSPLWAAARAAGVRKVSRNCLRQMAQSDRYVPQDNLSAVIGALIALMAFALGLSTFPEILHHQPVYYTNIFIR